MLQLSELNKNYTPIFLLLSYPTSLIASLVSSLCLSYFFFFFTQKVICTHTYMLPVLGFLKSFLLLPLFSLLSLELLLFFCLPFCLSFPPSLSFLPGFTHLYAFFPSLYLSLSLCLFYTTDLLCSGGRAVSCSE